MEKKKIKLKKKRKQKKKRDARSQAHLRLFSPHGSIRLGVKFLTSVGSKKNT